MISRLRALGRWLVKFLMVLVADADDSWWAGACFGSALATLGWSTGRLATGLALVGIVLGVLGYHRNRSEP